MSDEQGRYVLGGLEPGVYNLVLSRVPGRLEATAPGRGGPARPGRRPTRRPT